MARFEVNAVVADEARELQQPRVRRLDEAERKLRLAGTRRSPDKHGASTCQHRGGMHGRSFGRHHMAGSRTMKRAPSTTAASPAAAARSRFSARMRPPCASMMYLEIDSPRPEFCPNG